VLARYLKTSLNGFHWLSMASSVMKSTDPNFPPSEADLKQLSKSLESLRDAMVEASLHFKDVQFEMVSQVMQIVAAHSNRPLSNSKEKE
jgi:hypothetical protein